MWYNPPGRNSRDLLYDGRNLTITELANGTLKYSDLPCMMYGLDSRDLVPTEAYSLIAELDLADCIGMIAYAIRDD